MSALLVSAGLALAVPGTALADAAPLDPADPATPATVTTEALPTVQVNGVVWSQVVVGNTVFAAGRFSRARPAGAAPGTSETVRNNLLAYDIRTGALVTSFAPSLNGQALVVAASPDGSRVYVGGEFTSANGQARSRVAAYDTATGLLADWRPNVNGAVRAIAVSGSAVYLGGSFSAVGTAGRTRLAAVSPAGALLPWAPVPGYGPTSGNRLPLTDPATGKLIAGTIDPVANARVNNDVLSLVVAAGGAQVVAAGRFDTLNGVASTGVGALDPVTGATRPFAVNQLITNQGVNSAVYSLSTDGTSVYGTGYDYYGPGNLEGTFAADAATGALRWVADCRGDTYASYPAGGAVYTTSHTHNCANAGGFPQFSDPVVYKYATAFSAAPTGTNHRYSDLRGNTAFIGKAAPSMLPWYPKLAPGTVTGQNQAGWSVAGNGAYVVYGGEFPRVNGAAQQALVRFALPGTAPGRSGPTADGLTPAVTSFGPGTARVSWRESYDNDNENLTYRVYRDDGSTPVYQVTTASSWFDLQTVGFLDTGVPAGTHTYRVGVVDPMGNRNTGTAVAVTVAAGTTAPRTYADVVRADGAVDLWSFSEGAGSTTAFDRAGGSDLSAGTGVRLGVPGAVVRDADTAASFNGTSTGLAAEKVASYGRQTFSVEAWFSTRSTTGGKIVGFGTQNTGTSVNYDRHVYLDAAGKVYFGTYTGALSSVVSPASYNDGRWHHVVASLGPKGQALYLDGALVASRADATSAEPKYGYWRVGGDNSWAGAPFFTGTIDEVAVYPAPLSGAQVAGHWTAGSTGTPSNTPPTAAFTSAVDSLTASFDGSASADAGGRVTAWSWTFGDGATGTGVTARHTYAAAGTYPVALTVTDDAGATGTRTGTVTVTAPPVNRAPTARFTVSGSGSTAVLDASTSTDPDGTVVGYSWDLGDGTTATGVRVSHTYAAAGTYPVQLTVTDGDGATGTVGRPVTAPLAVVSDDFERTVASGLGTADLGGAWSVAGGSSSVSGGAAHLSVLTAGATTTATLPAVSADQVAVQAGISLATAPTGGGTYVHLAARRTAANAYRAAVKFLPDGRVTLGVTRVVSGAETTLSAAALSGVSYVPGTVLQVRLDVSGAGSSTVAAKAWPAGSAEPAGWQVSAVDTTAALQAPGGLALSVYASGTATALPVRLDADRFWAGPAGSVPAA